MTIDRYIAISLYKAVSVYADNNILIRLDQLSHRQSAFKYSSCYPYLENKQSRQYAYISCRFKFHKIQQDISRLYKLIRDDRAIINLTDQGAFCKPIFIHSSIVFLN